MWEEFCMELGCDKLLPNHINDETFSISVIVIVVQSKKKMKSWSVKISTRRPLLFTLIRTLTVSGCHVKCLFLVITSSKLQIDKRSLLFSVKSKPNEKRPRIISDRQCNPFNTSLIFVPFSLFWLFCFSFEFFYNSNCYISYQWPVGQCKNCLKLYDLV